MLIAAVLAGLNGARADTVRHRVLSLNLCTDQLLLAVADPADILAVTRLASDCSLSVACDRAAGRATVRGTAEEVLALQPDLVLGGRTAAGPAMLAARRLGVPVLELEPADSLDAIRRQIIDVAAAVGRPERGGALAAAFDSRLASIPPPPATGRMAAAIYEANGFTVGAGSLADDVLRRAGLDNFATLHGIDRYAVVPLEVLVAQQPDLLVTDAPAGSASLAEAVLQHPVLAEAFRGRRVALPSRLWLCGAPDTLEAVERLVQARLGVGR